jgi:transposase-like protein
VSIFGWVTTTDPWSILSDVGFILRRKDLAMDPHSQFCHNPDCPARGQVGQGNIGVHSLKEQRYRCSCCGKAFAATTGTPFYRLATDPERVTLVLTLLAHGCPLQAIVAAFGCDERTVASWQARAGKHCQQLHEHLVQQGNLDLVHVQADEIWVKLVGRRVWMAMAMAVPSRLWLGGVVSPHRDQALITSLVQRVRACAVTLALLVCVDGLASYVTAFRRVFRHPVHTGKPGRPRLEPEPGLLLGQVIKRYAKRRVASVEPRVVQGSEASIQAVLSATGGGKGIHTAYIERLNATFRSALAVLVRRGRALARTEAVVTSGMYLVGCAYNFCWKHESLRQAGGEETGRKWAERTPAMAAGLTDHCWTMAELLHAAIPLPAWVAPKRRRRPSERAEPPALALAA